MNDDRPTLRTWLCDLTRLTARRAATEQDLESTYRTGSDKAEREYAAKREAIETNFAVAQEVAEKTFRERMQLVKVRFAADDTKARRAEQIERSKIEEKGADGERTAQRKWDEAAWAAETVYEAKEGHPRKKFKETCKALGAALDELRGIERDADALMKRCRMPRPGAGAELDETQEPGAVLDRSLERARRCAQRLDRQLVMRLFQDVLPLAMLVLPAGGVAVALGMGRGWRPDGIMIGVPAAVLVVTGGLLAWLYAAARARSAAVYRELRRALETGREAYQATVREAEAQRRRDEDELAATRDREIAEARATYEPILAEIRQRRAHHLKRIEEKFPPIFAEIRQRYERDVESTREAHERAGAEAKDRCERELAALESAHRETVTELESGYGTRRSALEREWSGGVERARSIAADLNALSDRLFPAWDDPSWRQWKPGAGFAPVVRFGSIDVDMARLPGGLPGDERLDVGEPTRFTVPAVLSFPDECSLLMESGPEGRPAAVAALRTVMFRLLTAIPPGKLRFTIIDPIGLGQNFAGFMHLADYNEALVGGKIWTETRHIEQRLADLTEHMENVIQKYLRNEYETIAQYNEAAGEIAEPYRFVVISDFPTNFNDSAARRLASILDSGPRCGVYALILRDTRLDLPRGIGASDLRDNAVTLAWRDGGFAWADEDFEAQPLALDPPPDESFVTEKLKLVGEGALDASRVEVPFDVIAPPPERFWDAEAAADVKVPLGRCGATRLQYLTLGHGTNQHALIAGKTGSGKSTLLHVLVTNLALWYGPDEVELYLVDFKKGVEFKTYAAHELPHARAVAIESDREFGLSVLHRLDQELKRRGNAFRELGVQDLAGYRKTGAAEPIPRTLLIIDEFQEFFVDDDKIAQDAALLLDRLVRQGRAFGMHVLLGSQTLGGAYTLARSTIGQMGVRIALQCSETDSYMILSDDNAAARLLARPGEAIYNDANGQVEGNSPFQICWLPEATRERYLGAVRDLARQRDYVPPQRCIVFEGNAPADPAASHVLTGHLDAEAWPRVSVPAAWLGEAVAIKDPTAAEFSRRSGGNLLIAGQRDEAALAMMTMALVSLAAQCPPARARFVVLDGTPEDAPGAGYLARAAAGLPHNVRIVGWRDVGAALGELAGRLAARGDDAAPDDPSVFVLVHGLQRYRALRRSEDDFSFSMSGDDKPVSADRHFAELLREGPAAGMHVLLWCDTAANVQRHLDRQALREFDNRVLLQMSASDSQDLIDSPLASRLGLQRALLWNEERGTLEKFRPYALPSEHWLDEVARRLAARGGAAAPTTVETVADPGLTEKPAG